MIEQTTVTPRKTEDMMSKVYELEDSAYPLEYRVQAVILDLSSLEQDYFQEIVGLL
jgi:hypothetical protein